MDAENGKLQRFGKFQLDTRRKVLRHEGETVPMPLKELELLCVLVENRGELVTKNELLDKVWADSFVEESNLSRHIYLLRKTLKGLGAEEDLIENVARRGYRFSGEIHENDSDELIIEKHSFTRTLIEEHEDSKETDVKHVLPPVSRAKSNRVRIPILVGAIILATALGFYFYRQNSEPTQTIKSIAVLPLKSFSPESESEPIGLRITDALITKLGNLSEISVRPTNSVLRFNADGQDAVEIGRKLEVDAILDGRVQAENNRLRITLQLVSVKTGEQIWSEQFDGKTGEILALQDTISNRLRQKFAFVATEKFNRRPTENNEAYEAYLKGRYFWNQRTPDSYFKAIGYFEEAVRFDPNFALAYSGIADSYVLLNRRYVGSSEEALPKAAEAASKALELDDTLAEAQTSMGLVKSVYNRNWQESENRYRRAIELNPNYALAYGWYGMDLAAQKRFDEAETQMRKAEQLDPTSRNIAVYLAVNFYWARQFDRAIEQSRIALALDPKLSTAYWLLSTSFEQQEMFDKAVEADLERQKIIAPETVEPLREAFLRSGIKGFWWKQIEFRKVQNVKFSTCNFEIATRYALLNEKNEALKIIEDNAFFGGTCWNAVNVEPAFDLLRDEPRFQEILRKMNLSQ